jgi:hypothetical protein
MKPLYMPLLKALGVLLLVSFSTWAANKLIDFPVWLVISIGVVVAMLTGFIDVQKNMTLKSYFRAINVWFNDAVYLYELDIRIAAGSNIDVALLREMIEREYATRAKLGVMGSNYLQLKLLEPARTVEIKIQPDVSQIAYLQDEGEADISETKIISIDLVDPVEFHYRKSDVDSVRNTLDALRDLAHDIVRVSGGQAPYFTVTVNRAAKGVPLRHPQGPGPSGVIQDNSSVRIRRDEKALQLQSRNPSSLVQHLTENLADLEPVA